MTKKKMNKILEEKIKPFELEDMDFGLYESKKDLELAKINEAYHRKQMEYYQEQIKILTQK